MRNDMEHGDTVSTLNIIPLLSNARGISRILHALLQVGKAHRIADEHNPEGNGTSLN
jgi:hypothetical protein